MATDDRELTTLEEEYLKGGTREEVTDRFMARLRAGEVVTTTCKCGAHVTMTPVRNAPAPYYVQHVGGDDKCATLYKHAHVVAIDPGPAN